VFVRCVVCVVQGPYDKVYILYAVVFSLWVLMTAWWLYAAFYLHSDTPMIVWKTLAPVPVLKTIILAISLSYWYTCQKWLMCSFWIAVALQNIQLIYESGSPPWVVVLSYRIASEAITRPLSLY
jgi:hypothetical protein